MQRILASRLFAGSERMSRFLRFAVEYALEGRASELKEYLLGLEIFDRPPSFDPRIDPIVRVEARRLRSKLKSYYEKAQEDEVVIEFPTGTYAPRFYFRGRKEEPAAAPSTSIAVLPFANLTPDPGSDYFSDGLSEELIHALTRVEGLGVVAWSSAVRLRDQAQELSAIGSRLGVGAILTGSIRKSGQRVRILARLIDAHTNRCVWSETFEKELADLFAIQEEISRAIAGCLKTRLLGPGENGACDPEAYDLYLRGRFYWNRRTAAGLERAVEYFQRVIALDPGFAAGHAGLADAYALRAEYGLEPPGQLIPLARAAARRALEIRPDLAEAHASLGLLESLYEWRWREAGEHYRQAIRLNPNYVTAHHWYACDYLALLGRFEESLEQMGWAIRLDPLSPVMRDSRAYVLMLARRFDDALAEYQSALELDPYFYKLYTGMGRVYIQQGLYSQAVAMLEKGRELGGDLPNIRGALAQACALEGRPEEAALHLSKLHEISAASYVPATTLALVHCSLGDCGLALDYLEQACTNRDPALGIIKVHPACDALRSHARFAALLTRVGFDD